jgi:dCTP deaminase
VPSRVVTAAGNQHRDEEVSAMTVLSRREMICRLREGSLVVSPILSAAQINANSIDLRMGTVVLMVRARGSSHVDPVARKNTKSRDQLRAADVDNQQKHERYEIPFGTRFLLHPGSLALVPTLEWMKLPADLMGTVTARSTWAREGLSIATATLIESNYEGIATLELANLGQIPIALYPGLRIAQIAFVVSESNTKRSKPGQFGLSFEPRQGEIAKDDDVFIPRISRSY